MKLKITYTNGKSYHVKNIESFHVFKQKEGWGYDISYDYTEETSFGSVLHTVTTNTHDVAEVEVAHRNLHGHKVVTKTVYAKVKAVSSVEYRLGGVIQDSKKVSDDIYVQLTDGKGWITHDGNPDNVIPLKDGETYEVVLEDDYDIMKGDSWVWYYGNYINGIIKYRIIPK